MPISAFEIMMAKVWASGLIILIAVAFSLKLAIRTLLAVPIEGSIPLFLGGTLVYLFFATGLGIFLGTIARSMPQFSLLFMLVVLPMDFLSSGETPLEAQPDALQAFMQLFRGADLSIVWPHFAAVAGIGVLFFTLTALRFRKSIATMGA